MAAQTASVRSHRRALDAHLVRPHSPPKDASQDVESPAVVLFDPVLSLQIDMATVLSEDGRRTPGEQAMARAWLEALSKLVPNA
jgi:hypothetical protein